MVYCFSINSEDKIKKDININADINTKINELKAKIKNQAESLVPKTEEPQTPQTLEQELFKYGPPVSPKEFIEGKEYFNNKSRNVVYPWVIDTLEEIFSGEYHAAAYNTVVILAGKGSGKSYCVSMLNTYLYYWILSFNNFSRYLKIKNNIDIDPTTTIQLVGMAKHQRQAKEIVFDNTSKFIHQVQAFRDRNWLPDPKITTELQYSVLNEESNTKFKKLLIVPGNSSATFNLGYAIFGGVIDEACFWAEKNSNPVEKVYSEFNTRRMSRFLNNGVVAMISSANIDGDFVELFQDKSKDDKSIYFKRKSTYDCQPLYFSQPRFILKVKHETADGSVEDLVLHPPESLRALYEKDQNETLKDWDAIPSIAGAPFYRDVALLMSKINKDRVDPCPDLGHDVAEDPVTIYSRLAETFRGVGGVKYRVHVDLAKGNLIKGHCGCGFAMCHKIADPNMGFKIKLDLALRFKAGQNKEIQVNEILELILKLKNDRGFDIEVVSFDQWQSMHPIQVINGWQNGVTAQELPVAFKHHNFLKNCIFSSQFDMYEDINLIFELKRLEQYGDDCVDHGINSFKDESDAVAGAAWSAAGLEAVPNTVDIVPPRVRRGIIVTRPGGGPGSYRLPSNNFPKYRK